MIRNTLRVAGRIKFPISQLLPIFVERMKEVGRLLKESDWSGGAWKEPRPADVLRELEKK